MTQNIPNLIQDKNLQLQEVNQLQVKLIQSVYCWCIHFKDTHLE